MTMKHFATGPDWIVWVVFVILVTISAVLLSGHGANLIAGYNTAPKECDSIKFLFHEARKGDNYEYRTCETYARV